MDRYNKRHNYKRKVDSIFNEVFDIPLDTLIDSKMHVKMNYNMGRQLCKVWEKKCGPLKESFWAKFPHMMDAISKMNA